MRIQLPQGLGGQLRSRQHGDVGTARGRAAVEQVVERSFAGEVEDRHDSLFHLNGAPYDELSMARRGPKPYSDEWHGDRVIAAILQRLIQDGTIDPRGKTPTKILKEIAAYHDAHPDHLELVTVDHTPDILGRARSYVRRGDHHLACVLFATWVEHKLNYFLASLSVGKLTESELEAMIRETSHRAKIGWVLRLFNRPKVPQPHAGRIGKLMELRNAFVHYKWRKASEQADRELSSFVSTFEPTVRYLQHYERKYIGTPPLRRVARLLHS